MRGRRRRTIISQTRIRGESTEAREGLERGWFGIMQREPGLASLVTAQDARREPFHRWLVFKQGYAPGLVRQFIRDAAPSRGDVLLDPFSGTGTLAAECARCDQPAVGVEAVRSLAYVSNMKARRSLPPLPEPLAEDVQALADQLDDPVHRAALICAQAGRLTSRGTVNKNAPPLREALAAAWELMQEDLRRPLPRANVVVCADGRTLDCVADASVGGVLTSPPYLSRHDYARLTRAHEEIYARWYAGPSITRRRGAQLSASPAAPASAGHAPLPDAVAEAAGALQLTGEVKLSRVVRQYFDELFTSLSNVRRVLQPLRPCWIVIGGARLKDVYVPTDTILAEFARSHGFDVQHIFVARKLIAGGRRFGTLQQVSPRESILVMRRAGG